MSYSSPLYSVDFELLDAIPCHETGSFLGV